MQRRILLLWLTLFMVSLTCLSFEEGQEPELISPLNRKFYSLADEKGVVAEAEQKLAADPSNIDLLIALGRAQASIWRFRDAIATFTRGIELAPENALLYRHRGHRYISTRQFDEAVEDLQRAATLKEKDFDILYHLGLAFYLKGQFEAAARVYEQCCEAAQSDDDLVAVSDWLYMSYRRLDQKTDAQRVLERITPDLQVEENTAYFNRLLFYKGLKKEEELLNQPEASDLEVVTISYGLANWHFYNGNKAKAREMFEQIVAGTYWPAFAFIAAEAELVRMKLGR